MQGEDDKYVNYNNIIGNFDVSLPKKLHVMITITMKISVGKFNEYKIVHYEFLGDT